MNLSRLSTLPTKAAGYRRAVRFVWTSAPGWTLAGMLLLGLQGVLPVVSLYMLKLMIDSVSAVLEGGGSLQQVFIWIALAGGVALASGAIQTLAAFVTKVQGRRVVDYMNEVIQAKAVDVDLAFYENPEYHDSLHRAQQEAHYRPVMVVNGLAQILRSAVSLAGVAWLLLDFHWGALVVLIVAVLPGMGNRILYARRQYSLQRAITLEERRSWYYHLMTIGVEFAKELRMFGLGETVRNRFQDLRRKIRRAYLELDAYEAALSTIAQVVSIVAVYSTYAWIAYRTLQGANTLGDLVMYYQAFQRGQGFLQDLLGGLAKLYENNLFLSNLYEFLDLENQLTRPANPLPAPRPMRDGIRIANVHFSYPGSERDVLRGVNMEIAPGEVVALVGENGCGKTTLVKLLCRLYDPDGGQISIDGVDLREMDPVSLRRELGVIFQDYVHYNLTARDNIWFGGVHQPSDERLMQAARQAEAHDMIMQLPQGYDTFLGKLFTDGTELSIGQWQKIALARAFFRDSQVIVLDEPTSALDPKAEYDVFMKFRQLLNGRTALLISHRLSTVRMADRIYVLHDGRIIESGTHDQLVYQHGVYAHLFEKQAESYR